MRFSRTLGCFAAAIAIMAVAAGSASAATRWVNDDVAVGGNASCADPGFATISAAVAAALATDTIEVCEGTYVEQVNVNKTLTINGPHDGVPGTDGSRGVGEAMVRGAGASFSISADDVVIDGLTIEDQTGGFPGAAVWMQPTVDGTELRNNVIQDNVVGVFVSNHDAGNPAVIEDNLFNDNTQPGSAGGHDIYADEFTSGVGVTGVEIRDNTFTRTAFTVDSWAFGLSNTSATPFTEFTIEGNEIDNHGRGGYAFNTDDSSFAGNTMAGYSNYGLGLFTAFGPDENTGWTIDDNTLTGGGGTSRGVWIDGGEATLTGNTLSSNGTAAISVDTAGSSATAHLNNIAGNGAGYANAGGSAQDADCNWWGAADGPSGAGPGSGDSVSTGVDFTPWLTAPAPGGPCDGPLPAQIERKEAVRDSLATKQGSATGKNAKEIGEAIKHIDKSLEPGLWVDDNHLDPKQGHRVFSEEKDAVTHLSKVTAPDVSPEIDELVDIDHDLAETAIDDAEALPSNPKRDAEIGKANEELAKGDADATAGDSKQAIDHYRKAWEHAQKAIKAG